MNAGYGMSGSPMGMQMGGGMSMPMNGMQGGMGMLTWMPCANGQVPPNALICGEDPACGPLYAGRGMIGGNMHCGKISPRHGGCYIGYGGKEEMLRQYEVLCCDPNMVEWVQCQGVNFPMGRKMVEGGQCNGPLYVARAWFNGALCVGKAGPQLASGMSLSYAGREDNMMSYEILCYRNGMGMNNGMNNGVMNNSMGMGMQMMNGGMGMMNNMMMVQWQPCMNGMVPPNALVCGEDPACGPLYAGRGMIGGNMHCGKISPRHGGCYIGYGGKEEMLTQCEVLCCDPNMVEWVQCQGTNFPMGRRMVEGGQCNGPLYVARAWFNGALCVGKAGPQLASGMSLSYAGREDNMMMYEVLCYRM